MSFASIIKNELMARMDAFVSDDGLGPDAYFAQPAEHPMAWAKFLSTAVILKQTRILSQARFDNWLEVAVRRLSALALETELGIAWGLGFPWRDLTPEEPYLITSALVCSALRASMSTCGSYPELNSLHSRALTALEAWTSVNLAHDDTLQVNLPIYSFGIRLPVYNPAACALACILEARGEASFSDSPTVLLTDKIKYLLNVIASARIEGVGWPYSATNGVIDLLHQCYLLGALRSVLSDQESERILQEIVSTFFGCGQYLDAVEIVDKPSGDAWFLYGSLQHHRPLPSGQAHLRLHDKPARLWSLGELLVLTTVIGDKSAHVAEWAKYSKRLASQILNRLKPDFVGEQVFPRHSMHACHGLACLLASMRRRTQATTTVLS